MKCQRSTFPNVNQMIRNTRSTVNLLYITMNLIIYRYSLSFEIQTYLKHDKSPASELKTDGLTHLLHLHKPQSRLSTCKTGRCRARPGWWRRNPGTGWCRSCLCCPQTDVSIESGCEEPQERYRWTERHWLKNCERVRILRPHPEPADHTLHTHNDVISNIHYIK